MHNLSCKDFMKAGNHVFLSGIGGISMSALAEYLYNSGLTVSGSDMNSGAVTDKLSMKGIKVFIGHGKENIADADFIIRSAAVRDDNEEIIAARERGIPVFERARAWGEIMSAYKNAVCIAGTHGKTTTTGMFSGIALAAGTDPTIMLGGNLKSLGGSYRIGYGDMIVAEACEYCNSFLNFTPTVAVILNVEADHLDFFKGIEDIRQSFRAFAELTPANGTVIINGDDPDAVASVRGIRRKVVTFGLGNGNDVRAMNVEASFGIYSFDVVCNGMFFARAELKTPGEHNMKNALAAAACAIECGIPPEAVEQGLAVFTGVGRRFEYKGEYGGAPFFDDYAHHPSEVKAALTAASQMGFRRTVAVFQPHTYSRTKALFNDFASALSVADEVIVCEIYAARERNPDNYSAADLAKAVEGASFAETLDRAYELVRDTVKSGDVVLTIGAGDVYKVGERLLEEFAGEIAG